MFTLTKRPLYVFSNKLRRNRQPVEWMKQRWIADFSKPDRACFIIKPEISYNANLEKGALFLGLKKKNCMAWIETENRVYVDQLIEAHFRFDSAGGYCAAGIMFRVAGHGTGAASGTYYLALISSKGYFRLDAVNNNIPQPLIGWTKAPGLNGGEANLKVIAKGDHLIFFLNGRWLAEAHDMSISGGHLGFALASYDSEHPASEEKIAGEVYTCRAWLDTLMVDSRIGIVEAEYQKWNDSAEISAESRFRLAHSFAALNNFDVAYYQLLKAWKQREETAKSVAAAYTEMRTVGEFLFAARMASQIKQYAAAEEYINACQTMEKSEAENLDILAEKAKILSEQNKYRELAAFMPEYIELSPHIPSLYALLGHACWNLNEYQAAADSWDKAFALDNKNGLYAASAANAYEKMEENDSALQRRMDSAQCFLEQEALAEIGTLIPKLLALANGNGEAHELAGKCAAAIGDNELAEAEMALADKIKNPPPPEPLAETKEEEPVAKISEPQMAETTIEEIQPLKVSVAKKPPAKLPKPATVRKTAVRKTAERTAPPKKTEKKAGKKPTKKKTPVKKAEKKPELVKKPAAKTKPAVKEKTKPAAVKKSTAKPKAAAPAKKTAAKPKTVKKTAVKRKG